jgi:acetylornithine deacetylase/succinyl-diaminopimelate desuccinylase-like protein
MTRAETLLREIIALPSVNPAFLPDGHPHAGEHRVADYLAAWSAKAGLDIDFQEVFERRRNVLCRLAPPGDVRQRIVLAPHLDTVNFASPDQEAPLRLGDRVYGRGACDTKGSVAAMLAALAELARVGRRPRHTEFLFAGLVDEEHAQAGSRVLARSGLRADLAIVGEPTRLRVVTAHKGNLWMRLVTHGRAAHGATPHLGRNAIYAMARVVTALETDYRSRLALRRHPLLGSPTLSVGAIRGGTQANIVPDRCEIVVDRRTLPGETNRTVQGELRSCLRQARCSAALHLFKAVECPALETNPRLPLVREFLRVAHQRIGGGAQFFCDAAVLAAAGIPSIVFGPGDIAQAHTNDEWVSLTEVERAAGMLVQFLRSLP